MPDAPAKPMKRPDIEGMEARVEAAQDGPYHVTSTQSGDAVIARNQPPLRDHPTIDSFAEVLFEADWGTRDTATFLAHARQDIPALITHIAALEARQVKLEAVVEAARLHEGTACPMLRQALADLDGGGDE